MVVSETESQYRRSEFLRTAYKMLYTKMEREACRKMYQLITVKPLPQSDQRKMIGLCAKICPSTLTKSAKGLF